MKTNLQKLLEITWLKWLWTMKGEIALAVLAVSLFFYLTGWLRAIDATAAPLDAGILMAPAVGVIAVVAGLILFWAIIRILSPRVDRWFDGEKPENPDERFISFDQDWQRAGPAVRLSIFTGLLIAVILAVAFVTLAVR